MVKFGDIEDAFFFVSGSDGESTAFLQKSTGRVFCRSETGDLDEIEAAGIDEADMDADDWVALPGKHDLDLGQRLVYRFASERLPQEYDRIRAIFSRRGAYARFKDFLAEKEMLQSWYDFEQEAEKQALLQWCRENDIAVCSATHEGAPMNANVGFHHEATKFTKSKRRGLFGTHLGGLAPLRFSRSGGAMRFAAHVVGSRATS